MFNFSSIRKGILEDYHGNETSSFLANSNPRVAFKKIQKLWNNSFSKEVISKFYIYIYKYLRKEKDLHFDDVDLVIYFSDFASWINPLRSKGESQSPRIQIRMKLAHFWLSIFKKNCNFVLLYFYSSIHWFSLLYFIIIKLVNAVADDLSLEYYAHFCHGEERVKKCIKSLYFYYWSYMRKTQVATPSRLKNSSKD